MPVHRLALIVDGSDLRQDVFVDRLIGAGCDNAAIGRSNGIQYIDLNREAASLEEAVLPAIEDIGCVEGVGVVRSHIIIHTTEGI